MWQVNGLMVVGIDTYHDTVKRGRSVAGFVASLNNTCTRYYTRWAFQQTGEELHNSLRMFMTSNSLHFVLGTCGIDFFVSVRFLKKNQIRFVMSLVLFGLKKYGSVKIL